MSASDTPSTIDFPFARRLSWRLAVASVGVTMWALFAPRPYALVIGLCALAPWVAVILIRLRPELSLLGGERKAGAEELAMAWAAPATALFVRSLDHDFLNPAALMVASILPGAALWTAMWLADRRRQSRTTMICSALVAGLWGWGVLAYADVALNRGRFEIATGQITNMALSSREQGLMDVVAVIDGRQRSFDDMPVSGAVYASHHMGGTVCLEIHTGLLGVRHAYARACPLL